MEFYPYETTQYSWGGVGGQTPFYHYVTIIGYSRMNAQAKVYGFPQVRALNISSSSQLNSQRLREKKINIPAKDSCILNRKDSRRSSLPQVYPLKSDTTCYIVMSHKT